MTLHRGRDHQRRMDDPEWNPEQAALTDYDDAESDADGQPSDCL